MPAAIPADVVFYDFLKQSPVGVISIAASQTGLCAVTFGRTSRNFSTTILTKLFPSARFEQSPAVMAGYLREMERYFQGHLTSFTMPLDLRGARTSFQKKVLKACMTIPFGSTVSYGQLAARAGSPRGARAVGNVMAANPIPIVIPCHRVLASKGALGGFSLGLSFKKKLLMHEGITLV